MYVQIADPTKYKYAPYTLTMGTKLYRSRFETHEITSWDILLYPNQKYHHDQSLIYHTVNALLQSVRLVVILMK